MKKFINDESGATAIEYGLIAAAMGLMLVIVMPILATAFRACSESWRPPLGMGES